MKCPDTGTWQAYLDGELTKEERISLQEHSQNCPECTDTLDELSNLERWSTASLTAYRSATDKMPVEHTTVQKANTENNKIKVKSKGATWMKKGFKRWAAVAASITLLTAALTMTPVQQAVANFLSIFRVQQIEVIQLNPDDMRQMANDIQSKVGEVDLQQFGKVDIEQKPEQQRIPLDEMAAKVPFEFKQPAVIPDGFMPEQLASLISEGKSEFQLNVEQVNSLLKSLGSPTLLPASLDGKAFSVSTPAIAQVRYVHQDGKESFSYSQFESPEIIAPSGVDANALRAALLDLPILPDDLRTQLASIEDWQHTMVLPSAQESEEIKINGNKAILSMGTSDYTNLIWIDGDVIYQMSGNLDRDNILQIANSLYQSN
ncbi:MAG: DUF4367 domain-containing protein [Firmicutes bacterium]|nr:DUF4367 domain-containing protein [Bacillota bacterium]